MSVIEVDLTTGEQAQRPYTQEELDAISASQPQPSPEELRAQAVAEIEARRDAALRAGVVLNGVRYHTDDTFITELLGLLMGYQVGIYTGTQAIRTMDNTIVPLDAPQITAVAAAVGEHRKTVYAQSWAEKDALQ